MGFRGSGFRVQRFRGWVENQHFSYFQENELCELGIVVGQE